MNARPGVPGARKCDISLREPLLAGGARLRIFHRSLTFGFATRGLLTQGLLAGETRLVTRLFHDDPPQNQTMWTTMSLSPAVAPPSDDTTTSESAAMYSLVPRVMPLVVTAAAPMGWV